MRLLFLSLCLSPYNLNNIGAHLKRSYSPHHIRETIYLMLTFLNPLLILFPFIPFSPLSLSPLSISLHPRRATVVEHRETWYMDDGGLNKILCEEETESLDE